MAKFHRDQSSFMEVLGKFVKYYENSHGNQALIHLSGSIAIRPSRACCVTVVCQGMILPVGNLCLISIGDSVFDIRSDF